MGAALQLSSGYKLNPSTTVSAITMNTGDSATVNNFVIAAQARLVQAWSPGATAGIARIRSPRLHDLAQGIRLQRAANNNNLLLPDVAKQPLYPGDVLTLEVTGGAAETDMLAILVYYSDLPGASARLVSWSDIRDRIVNIAGVENDLTSGATAGQYGATDALNNDFDTLQAGIDYALLGYVCSVLTGVIALSGPDTANMLIGGPGLTDTDSTRQYFVDMSNLSGLPLIPVINANNKGVTLAKSADVAASTATKVSWIFAQLKP